MSFRNGEEIDIGLLQLESEEEGFGSDKKGRLRSPNFAVFQKETIDYQTRNFWFKIQNQGADKNVLEMNKKADQSRKAFRFFEKRQKTTKAIAFGSNSTET